MNGTDRRSRAGRLRRPLLEVSGLARRRLGRSTSFVIDR
jgi:hypothetical protein